MDISRYKRYISEETMMGPNSVRILAELFDRHPLQSAADDLILDLGCGTGLTRFAQWGIGGQVTPVCEDANNLHFEKKQFHALVSIDSYHYFAGHEEFFQEKILPFMKDSAEVLIGIPGLEDEYTGRAEDLLSDWLGDEAYMFKSLAHWKQLIGSHPRIELVET